MTKKNVLLKGKQKNRQMAAIHMGGCNCSDMVPFSTKEVGTLNTFVFRFEAFKRKSFQTA